MIFLSNFWDILLNERYPPLKNPMVAPPICTKTGEGTCLSVQRLSWEGHTHTVQSWVWERKHAFDSTPFGIFWLFFNWCVHRFLKIEIETVFKEKDLKKLCVKLLHEAFRLRPSCPTWDLSFPPLFLSSSRFESPAGNSSSPSNTCGVPAGLFFTYAS